MKHSDGSIRAWDTTASHPLQSWAWGEFRRWMGIDVVRLDGVGQLTFHRIPHSPLTIGYFPKGPMPTAVTLAKLKALGKQKSAIFIQLEPNIICHREPEGRGDLSNTEIASLIARNDNNLQLSHHPLFTKYTFVLDLTKPEEELLMAMHHKTRYNIKLAQKHGVVVKENNSQKALEVYLKLTAETTNRQGFYAHNEQYHRTMWKLLHEAGIAKLFTATYQDKILAAWIVFIWNDTIYYPYGASSREHREVMAPTLMLWEIIRAAKNQGLKRFDLWGALGPPSANGHDPNDPLYGFHRFKEGFAPNLVEFIGSYDLVINKPLYSLYTLADTIRWFFLKRKFL